MKKQMTQDEWAAQWRRYLHYRNQRRLVLRQVAIRRSEVYRRSVSWTQKGMLKAVEFLREMRTGTPAREPGFIRMCDADGKPYGDEIFVGWNEPGAAITETHGQEEQEASRLETVQV